MPGLWASMRLCLTAAQRWMLRPALMLIAPWQLVWASSRCAALYQMSGHVRHLCPKSALLLQAMRVVLRAPSEISSNMQCSPAAMQQCHACLQQAMLLSKLRSQRCMRASIAASTISLHLQALHCSLLVPQQSLTLSTLRQPPCICFILSHQHLQHEPAHLSTLLLLAGQRWHDEAAPDFRG